MPYPSLPAAGDDDDPGKPGAFDRVGQRIEHIVLGAVGAERQVEDANVEAVAVAVLDDPVDRGDDLGDVGHAVGGANLHVRLTRARRHAYEVIVGVASWSFGLAPRVARSDDAGHVSAVAVAVDVARRGRLRVERQVRAVDQAAGEVGLRVYARVDHRNVDAVAGDAALPQVSRADRSAVL